MTATTPPTTPVALLNPLTLDQLRMVLIGYLQAANDPITNWNPGGRRLTQMQYAALGINNLLGGLFPAMAGQTWLDFAQQLPPGADPDTWVDIIAEQIFALTRVPAVLTQQTVLVSSDGTHGPFAIDSSFVVINPLTGNRYYAITTGTLTTGAPNAVTVIVRAEAPNDPARGILYADGPNTLTELASPWQGVTVTNAPPAFSAVTTTPSPALGLGVVTVSGTPPALAVAYDFEIVEAGQNTTAMFQWRSNGGPWSAPVTMAATFAIPTTSIVVHFANDSGGSNPSFRVGDVYSFTAPGTAISTPGTPRETSAALAQRCYGRLPDLTGIPLDKHVVWAIAVDSSIKRVSVALDATYPGRYLVTIAGAPGTSPLSGGIVAAVQAAIDQLESIGRLSVVAAATVTTVTATNGANGIVKVPVAKLAQIEAAANLAWSAYVNSTDIGGVVRVAKLIEILMDAGAIEVLGLLLNGGGNVVLAVNAVAVAADLASLTWVGV
jgi:hypothetical protein